MRAGEFVPLGGLRAGVLLPHTFAYLRCPLGGGKLLLTSNHLHNNEHEEAHQASRQPGQHAEPQQGNARHEPTELPDER